MSKPCRILLPLLCLALAAAGAHASELGDTRVLSHVGQPLRAEVELTGITALEQARLAVRPASPDIYQQARVRPDPALDTLQLSIEQRDGRTWVRATSATPVDAPYIHVFLEIPSGGQHAVRALTFWLPPAPPAPAPAVAARSKAAPRPKAGTAGPAPAVVAAAPAPATGDAPRVTPAVLRRDAAAQPAVAAAAARPLEPQMMLTAAPQPAVLSTRTPPAPAAGTVSTRVPPAPAAGLVSTQSPPGPGPGVISTGTPPAPAAGVVSTRLPAASAPAGTVVSTRKPEPAAARPAAPVAPTAALQAAAARPLTKAEAASCTATVQKMGERLSQCAATQVENERIAAQLVELESRVALLKRALENGKAAKGAAGKPWIWTIAVPAAIAILAMAGAAWFAFGRKGRRAGDKRKGKARKVEPSIDEAAPEASAEAAEPAPEQAAEEKAAVRGMVAKVRAVLGKMPSRKKKAAIEAAEPEPATEEA